MFPAYSLSLTYAPRVPVAALQTNMPLNHSLGKCYLVKNQEIIKSGRVRIPLTYLIKLHFSSDHKDRFSHTIPRLTSATATFSSAHVPDPSDNFGFEKILIFGLLLPLLHHIPSSPFTSNHVCVLVSFFLCCAR